MRTLGLLITVLAMAPQATTDQKPAAPEGTIIASAQVTGFDIDRLSPGLREAIRGVAGTPLNQQRLDDLAARIEAERPRYVAAVRTVMDPDGQARVFFVVGRQDQPDRDDNVNSRYIVEDADITGVPEADVSQALRDDLRALVGKRLDSDDADRLQERIERELPRYDVSRSIKRGSEVGRIKLLYEARKKEPPPWLRFEPLRANLIYHSDQGWGGLWDLNIGNRNVRFIPVFALDNSDDSIEEYSGVGLRFETRKLGTRRLGASFEWTWFDQDWRSPTLAALPLNPELPRAYDTRTTVTPLLKFAFTPDLSIAGGVSISELNALPPAIDSQMANAAVAAVEFDRQWKQSADVTHRAVASFGVRAGSRSLESDLAYKRYLGQGSYSSTSAATTCRRPRWPAASRATRRSSSASRSATRGRCAAGTSTTSRRPAATACSTRRSSTATRASRCSSISDRYGTRTPNGRSASRPASASRRAGVLHGRLPAQHRQSAPSSRWASASRGLARGGSARAGARRRRARSAVWPAARVSAQTLTVEPRATP